MQISKLIIGVFVGVLAGVSVTLLWTAPGKTESFEDYRSRTLNESRARAASRAGAPGGSGHGDGAHGGANPHGGGDGSGEDPHGANMSPEDRAKSQAAKVHFMKKFVRALTETPENKLPRSGYQPLLKDPKKPFGCAQCHDPDVLDLEGMLKMDPGDDAVTPFRQDRAFMGKLMEKWVARLNAQHADLLVAPVTCTSCHAIDPRDFEEQLRVFPPLMARFVNALRERPVNKNPAPDWKPLLKDPSDKSMMCATCHGATGERMEQNFGAMPKDRPEDFANDKEFMVRLMENWVTRLNRQARHLVTKAVSCRDCHATDPRR